MGPLDHTVEQLLRELQPLRNQGRLRIAYCTGQLVVDTLFGGDEHAWRRKRRSPAYVKLAEHPDLPFSRMELYRSLRIYAICRRFPALLESQNIAPSHLIAVMALSERSQEHFLRMAEDQNLSVRELERLVRATAPPPAKTGR